MHYIRGAYDGVLAFDLQHDKNSGDTKLIDMTGLLYYGNIFNIKFIKDDDIKYQTHLFELVRSSSVGI